MQLSLRILPRCDRCINQPRGAVCLISLLTWLLKRLAAAVALKWHNRFTHHDQHHIERPGARGVVMERHKKEKQRLPDSFYDVSAL